MTDQSTAGALSSESTSIAVGGGTPTVATCVATAVGCGSAGAGAGSGKAVGGDGAEEGAARPPAPVRCCLRWIICAVSEGAPAAAGATNGAGAAEGAGAVLSGACTSSHCLKLFAMEGGLLAWKAAASSSYVI